MLPERLLSEAPGVLSTLSSEGWWQCLPLLISSAVEDVRVAFVVSTVACPNFAC